MEDQSLKNFLLNLESDEDRKKILEMILENQSPENILVKLLEDDSSG